MAERESAVFSSQVIVSLEKATIAYRHRVPIRSLFVVGFAVNAGENAKN